MNGPLWYKAWHDGRWLLAGCAAVLLLFGWVFVWLSAQIPVDLLAQLLLALPGFLPKIVGLPIDEIATPVGKIALYFLDPIVLVVAAVWAIARGSDTVAGELERGTLELLLAQPVRRIAVWWTQLGMLLAGCAVMAAAAWLGIALGLWTVDLGPDTHISAARFLPSSLNLLGLTVFLGALTTLVSALDNYRWRAIGVVGSVSVVAMIVKLLSRTAPNLEWLMYFTFLGAYWPQTLANQPQHAWTLLAWYNGVLLGLSAVLLAAAAWVFCRRDLPAPV